MLNSLLVAWLVCWPVNLTITSLVSTQPHAPDSSFAIHGSTHSNAYVWMACHSPSCTLISLIHSPSCTAFRSPITQAHTPVSLPTYTLHSPHSVSGLVAQWTKFPSASSTILPSAIPTDGHLPPRSLCPLGSSPASSLSAAFQARKFRASRLSGLMLCCLVCVLSLSRCLVSISCSLS